MASLTNLINPVLGHNSKLEYPLVESFDIIELPGGTPRIAFTYPKYTQTWIKEFNLVSCLTSFRYIFVLVINSIIYHVKISVLFIQRSQTKMVLGIMLLAGYYIFLKGNFLFRFSLYQVFHSLNYTILGLRMLWISSLKNAHIHWNFIFRYYSMEFLFRQVRRMLLMFVLMIQYQTTIFHTLSIIISLIQDSIYLINHWKNY